MPKLHNKYHGTAPANAIYIGRQSKWGNPFSHMDNTTAEFKTKSRDDAVDRYETWLLGQPDLVAAVKSELVGRDLLCFCSPKRCHGDVLLRVANE